MAVKFCFYQNYIKAFAPTGSAKLSELTDEQRSHLYDLGANLHEYVAREAGEWTPLNGQDMKEATTNFLKEIGKLPVGSQKRGYAQIDTNVDSLDAYAKSQGIDILKDVVGHLADKNKALTEETALAGRVFAERMAILKDPVLNQKVLDGDAKAAEVMWNAINDFHAAHSALIGQNSEVARALNMAKRNKELLQNNEQLTSLFSGVEC